jgi:hypothetical protein
VDPLNRKVEELERFIREGMRALRERNLGVLRHHLGIPRVFAKIDDDLDSDASPDSFVGARLRPRSPLGGLAVALPEPDEDLTVEAVAVRRR